MKYLIIALISLFSMNTIGQTGYIEVAPFNNSWSVNEMFKVKFGAETKLGYTNVTQFNAPYPDIGDFHMLMINDLSYNISKKFSAALGATYLRSESVRPSVGMQYFTIAERWQLMISTKLIIWDYVELLVLTKFQYAIPIKNNYEIVFRTDNIHKIGNGGHLISKFRFRAGIGKKKNQVGLAADLKFISNSLEFEPSYGIFYKRAF